MPHQTTLPARPVWTKNAATVLSMAAKVRVLTVLVVGMAIAMQLPHGSAFLVEDTGEVDKPYVTAACMLIYLRFLK